MSLKPVSIMFSALILCPFMASAGDLGSFFTYNTRVVLIGAALLGIACGLIGTFMLLRKRSLMGDAISHATLPGICLAFLIMASFGGTGKWLPGLLIGAALTGLLGMFTVSLIKEYTRIKADAALGIVLSVYFGLGTSLLTLTTAHPKASAAGLETFIYGKTASMLLSDAYLIAGTAAAILLACILLSKEFTVLCFDQGYAKSQGWPVMFLDALLMALVVLVTVIGLQAVGLILIIALLIIPPAAARFWTDRLQTMVLVSSVIGGISCLVGAGLSNLASSLPAGAIIVLTTAVFFGLSMLFGKQHGIVIRKVLHRQLNRKVARQHLLRAIYEIWEEQHTTSSIEASWEQLANERSWSARSLRRLLNGAKARDLITMPANNRYALTVTGQEEARRLVHNHRLWELYLIHYADVATSRVDRDADEIEHVLGPELVTELENRLKDALADIEQPALAALPNVHAGNTRKETAS